MASYVEGKGTDLRAHTVRVLNRDDPVVAAMTGRKATVVTFGSDVPAQPEAFGLVRDAGMTWLAWAEDTSLPTRRRKAAGDLPGAPAEIHVHRLMPVDALRIRGRHNALNALAALALARAIGLPLAPMLHGLRDYAGEPHRVEHVATLGGCRVLRRQQGHQRRRHRGGTGRARVPKDASWSSSWVATARARTSPHWSSRWRVNARAVGADRARREEDSRRAGSRGADAVKLIEAEHAARVPCSCAAARGAAAATRSSSRRPVPASTCSATTVTGRKSLSQPCANSRRRPGSHAEALAGRSAAREAATRPRSVVRRWRRRRAGACRARWRRHSRKPRARHCRSSTGR